MWAENLPWESLISLSGTTFLDTFTGTGGEPAYEVECEALVGVTASKLCEGPVVATLTNDTATMPASVLGVFEKVTLAKRVACTSTGRESVEISGEGNTWALEGSTRLATAVS